MCTPIVAIVLALATLAPLTSPAVTDAHQSATAQFQPQQVTLAASGGEAFVLGGIAPFRRTG